MVSTTNDDVAVAVFPAKSLTRTAMECGPSAREATGAPLAPVFMAVNSAVWSTPSMEMRNEVTSIPLPESEYETAIGSRLLLVKAAAGGAVMLMAGAMVSTKNGCGTTAA